MAAAKDHWTKRLEQRAERVAKTKRPAKKMASPTRKK